jgi:hypothetical protein
MAIEMMLCFLKNDANSIQMAQLYWSTEVDGTWSYTVKQIADHFGFSSSQISKDTAEAATAFIIDNRCISCGDPQTAKSRSDFTKIVSGPFGVCLPCADIERKHKEAQIVLQRKSERERQNAIWLRETSHDPTFDYQTLGYLDAFYAFVILVISEFDEESGEIVLPEAETFSPDTNALRKVTERLHNQSVLQFGQKTPLDAFVINEDDERSFRYYPARVSWRFALPEFSESYDSLLSELSSIVDGRNEYQDYPTTISDLWWHIGQAEGKRYLDLQLDTYNLSIEEGDKLREAIRYSLLHFSIPQLRNLLWRVARDTAAYAARRDVHTRRAINSIPGNLIKMCDRALADRWEINPYVLKWDEDEALLTTMLFDRLLRTGVTGFRVMTISLKASGLWKPGLIPDSCQNKFESSYRTDPLD